MGRRTEKFRCAVVSMAMLLCGAIVCWGQNSGDGPLAPLKSGNLAVWIVIPHDNSPATQKARIAAAGLSSEVKEQTAGSFGQAAGSMGRNAGDAGRTAASFGVGTTDLARAAKAANTVTTAVPELKHDMEFDLLSTHLEAQFPDLQVDFEDVSEDDLKADLEETAHTESAPDLLLGGPLPAWPAWVLRLGELTKWTEIQIPQTEDMTAVQAEGFVPQVLVLSGSRNQQVARAFLTWLLEGGDRILANKPNDDSAAGIAAKVYRNLLQGKPVGEDADPDLTGYRLPAAPLRLFARNRTIPQPAEAMNGEIWVDVMAVEASRNSAIVELRATGSAYQMQEIRHALMVLRKDAAGDWRVLQVSQNLAPGLRQRGVELLAKASVAESSLLRNEGSAPLGISQAAPVDGDQRSAQPELWWDNLGGATLQVVEWQVGGWADRDPSYLFFVPDSGSRLKTRVIARFAANQGRYRWRVWSVGADGTIVLSGWRTLNITSR